MSRHSGNAGSFSWGPSFFERNKRVKKKRKEQPAGTGKESTENVGRIMDAQIDAAQAD